jgi:hypothetical protein
MCYIDRITLWLCKAPAMICFQELKDCPTGQCPSRDGNPKYHLKHYSGITDYCHYWALNMFYTSVTTAYNLTCVNILEAHTVSINKAERI